MAGPACSMGLALDSMTDAERDLFQIAIGNPAIRKSDLAKRLQAAGHDVSAWMLRHHARKECKCRSKTT